MRWFAFSLMVVCAAMVGCEQASSTRAAEIPSPTVDTASSAVTAESETPEAAAVETSAPPAATPTEPAATPTEPAAAPTEPAATPTEPAAPGTEPPATAEPKPESASTAGAKTVRFVATQSVKVPTMMCPYSCWPKVKETLAAQPGVEGVQLASQTKETEIDNPVVELKTTADFNVEAAIAALGKANFADAVVVK
jgi:periplasmic mercuric ion binding protein